MNGAGVLIYDGNPAHSLADKVQAACAAFQRKLGQRANVCYVHESMLGTSALTTVAGGVRVIARPWVLRHHYQAGREDE